MSTADILEKGRTVQFLRGVLLEFELCLVHLRRGDGGYWGLRSTWYKSKHLSSPAINQVCLHAPPRDYFCGQKPVCSRTSARLSPPRCGVRERNCHAALFKAVSWCQDLVCRPVCRLPPAQNFIISGLGGYCCVCSS